MSARCFEAWVADRLAEKDIRNDYLVEIDRSSAAYPTVDEMLTMKGCLEAFIKMVVTKACRGPDHRLGRYVAQDLSNKDQYVARNHEICAEPVGRQMGLDL